MLPTAMKTHLSVALLSVQFLICVGSWQPVTAQVSNTPATEHDSVLTTEHVVNKLVQKSLERAHALTAYGGLEFIASNTTVSRVPKVRK